MVSSKKVDPNFSRSTSLVSVNPANFLITISRLKLVFKKLLKNILTVLCLRTKSLVIVGQWLEVNIAANLEASKLPEKQPGKN